MSWVLLAVSLIALPQVRAETDVYAVMLKLRYQAAPGAALSVKDVTVPMPTLSGSSPGWLGQFREVPRALRDAARQPMPTTEAPFDRALLPRRTRWIPEQDIERTLGRDPNNWRTFKPRHGTDGYLSLSKVLFTPEGLDALVYYEARRGGYGDGGYVWLHRQTAQSVWSVRKKIVSWMS
jgi:hypothetical protein